MRVERENGAPVALQAAKDAEEEAAVRVPEPHGLVVRRREQVAVRMRDPREVVHAAPVAGEAVEEGAVRAVVELDRRVLSRSGNDVA